jgi:CTP:molybdopterin cytidylyltransferase MocA
MQQGAGVAFRARVMLSACADSQLDLHVLVLAGGRGRRVAALVEGFHGRPVEKQFCGFGDERSLLQRSVDQALSLVSADRVRVICMADQARRVAVQLRDRPPIAVLEQPHDRGSGVAAMLGLFDIQRSHPATSVLIAGADQIWTDGRAIRRAAFAAAQHKTPVLLAAPPRFGHDRWLVPSGPWQRGLAAIAARVDGRAPRRSARPATSLAVAPLSTWMRLASRRAPRALAALAHYGATPSWQRGWLLEAVLPSLGSIDLEEDLLTPTEGFWMTRMRGEFRDLDEPADFRAWLERREATLELEVFESWAPWRAPIADAPISHVRSAGHLNVA